MIRRILSVVGLCLAVAFLPQAAWASGTPLLAESTVTATDTPTETPTGSPTTTSTETSQPTVTETVTSTAPPSVQVVTLDPVQWEPLWVAVCVVGAISLGGFVLGMRR